MEKGIGKAEERMDIYINKIIKRETILYFKSLMGMQKDRHDQPSSGTFPPAADWNKYRH